MNPPLIAEMHEVEPGIFLGLVPGDGIVLDAPKHAIEKLYFIKHGHLAHSEKDLKDFTQKLVARVAKRMGLPRQKRRKCHIVQY